MSLTPQEIEGIRADVEGFIKRHADGDENNNPQALRYAKAARDVAQQLLEAERSSDEDDLTCPICEGGDGSPCVAHFV